MRSSIAPCADEPDRAFGAVAAWHSRWMTYSIFGLGDLVSWSRLRGGAEWIGSKGWTKGLPWFDERKQGRAAARRF